MTIERRRVVKFLTAAETFAANSASPRIDQCGRVAAHPDWRAAISPD
jgi:hypothetical protein